MQQCEERILVIQQTPSGMGVSYHAVLSYRTDDPLAVRARFYPPGQAPVTWVLLREALLKGCYEVEPSGEGDVTIYACSPGEIVHVDLTTSGGPYAGLVASLHLPYDRVQQFLEKCNALIPFSDVSVPVKAVDDLIDSIRSWQDPRGNQGLS